MKRLAITVLALAALAGCSNPVEQAAEEGKNAFQTGMRTSEKARDLGAQKESFDRQSDEF
jgi:hypothetical protein